VAGRGAPLIGKRADSGARAKNLGALHSGTASLVAADAVVIAETAAGRRGARLPMTTGYRRA